MSRISQMVGESQGKKKRKEKLFKFDVNEVNRLRTIVLKCTSKNMDYGLISLYWYNECLYLYYPVLSVFPFYLRIHAIIIFTIWL